MARKKTRKKKLEPVASFRIKAGKKTTLYYEVNVWKTRKDFIAYTGRRDALGLCSTYKVQRLKNKRWETKKVCGEINLIRKRLYTEILSHELCHAAFGFCRRKKQNPLESAGKGQVMDIHCGEERYCYAQGYMMNEIVTKLNKLKLPFYSY